MAPVKNLDEVLNELGWDSGFQLPISNAENRALEEEVARLTLQKMNIVNNHNSVEGRLEAFKHHYKFVNQEIDQTQKIITAHKQQLDCENQRYIQLSQEKKNFESNLKSTQKKFEETEKTCASRTTQLEKHVAKMDRLKAETDWDEAALNAWEESLKKRDDDNELIKKFSQEDERKYNELECRRQALQNDCLTRANTIAKLIADIQNYELVMERTGKMIKQQVVERNALINQWKDTVKILQQRDAEIGKSQEKMILYQEMIERKNAALIDENSFLEHEKDNNRAIILECQDLRAGFAKLRRDYAYAVKEIAKMGPEVNALKTKVSVSAKILEKERMKSKQMDKDIYDKEGRLIKVEKDLERLYQKEDEINKNGSNSGERVNELAKILNHEKMQEDVIIMEIEILQNRLFKNQTVLKDEEDALYLMKSDTKTEENIIIKYQKRHATLKKQLDKVIETAYDFDFRIGLLEKQLYERDNIHYQDDYEEKEQRILSLEAELNEHVETSNFLQEQITRIHEEMRRLSTAMDLDKNDLEQLKEKLEYQMIFFDIGKKQVVTIKQSVQEKQVEENLIRLQVTNIDKHVKKEDKNIVNLQKLRLFLDQAMRERQLEISATKTILQAKRRNLDEDRGRLKSEISQRYYKLDILQKKYHVVLMSLGKDEDGKLLSVSHFKVKAAQEKFFLKNEGDNLDEKVKTAEKEIVAMENTLKLVNVTNTNFKTSLTQIKEDEPEVLELKALEKDLLNINFEMKKCSRVFYNKEQILNESKATYEEVKEKKSKAKVYLIEHEKEFRSIRSQANDKEEKLQRAECHLKKLQKQLIGSDLEKYHRDFEIRRIKDANQTVLHQLSKMSVSDQVLTPKINYYIIQYGLSLPKPDKSPSVSSATSLSLNDSCSSLSLDISEASTLGSKKSAITNKVNLGLNI
ncbi:unnamed protein product [Brassicogethes aeneus]|uniref:Coiled-coil domain-containing protein 39 n=1 Tax=Brassicogethes aeneus TaxID=1431903 RepID=A0A9P0B773_BRAAE|nr:unnamed protein product [Brassicogethes aeneus]